PVGGGVGGGGVLHRLQAVDVALDGPLLVDAGRFEVDRPGGHLDRLRLRAQHLQQPVRRGGDVGVGEDDVRATTGHGAGRDDLAAVAAGVDPRPDTAGAVAQLEVGHLEVVVPAARAGLHDVGRGEAAVLVA